jgi:6-phospho-3-hexuloisomerase
MTEPTPRPPSLAHTNVIVPARGLPALVAGRQLIRALAIPQNNIARGTTAMAESMFEMQGIQKRFAGIPALADAALRAGSAEVHALMGQKGAGRSTPNKTLTSNIHGDAGEAQFLPSGSPRETKRSGAASTRSSPMSARTTFAACSCLLSFSPNPVSHAANGDSRTETSLKQGYLMVTDTSLFTRAIRDLSDAVERIDDREVDRVVRLISNARHISVFGCGREGLQIRGLAMRLFHLGRSVSVVGDMTTPAIGKGDLLLVTAGPGMLSTVHALVSVAKAAGALVLTITAEPEGQVSKMSDEILVLPAQTMANDRGENVSILPMGSVYEGALFVLFEVLVLKLKAVFKVTDQVMRSNHTNLE